MVHKKILDIRKIEWNKVEVEYFDMKKNHHAASIKTIHYTPKHKTMEGYIIWEGKKVDISSLLR